MSWTLITYFLSLLFPFYVPVYLRLFLCLYPSIVSRNDCSELNVKYPCLLMPNFVFDSKLFRLSSLEKAYCIQSTHMTRNAEEFHVWQKWNTNQKSNHQKGIGRRFEIKGKQEYRLKPKIDSDVEKTKMMHQELWHDEIVKTSNGLCITSLNPPARWAYRIKLILFSLNSSP